MTISPSPTFLIDDFSIVKKSEALTSVSRTGGKVISNVERRPGVRTQHEVKARGGTTSKGKRSIDSVKTFSKPHGEREQGDEMKESRHAPVG